MLVCSLVALSLLLCAPLARAQTVPGGVLRGEVRDRTGAPVPGANVFLLETLDGVLTNDDGGFAIRTGHEGVATLAVRRIGFRPFQRRLVLPTTESLVLILDEEAAKLSAVMIEAARAGGDGAGGTTLTTLDVVSTPGTAANVNRAIQTLPGVQTVDDGTALFVRGGDHTETKILVDGAVLLGTTQLRTPVGTFVGTVDPFLLDGISFLSGGFGARYGNALSGIASLRTSGRPTRTSGVASAGLAAVSGAVAVDLPANLGLRGAANRLDLEPFLRLNGSPHHYEPAPAGHDVSGSLIWQPRPSGELKLFAIDQRSRLGVGVDEASHSGVFDVDIENTLAVLTWRDAFGALAPSVSVASARLSTDEDFGAFRLSTHLRSLQVSTMLEWTSSAVLTVRGGSEWEHASSGFEGAIPERGDDVAPDAPAIRFTSEGTGDRDALFVETQWRLGGRWSVTAGLRTDRSTLTDRRTLDPRLALALTLRTGLTLTAAWGIYHQVPDAMLFDAEFGDPSLLPMRAMQLVVGAQLESERLTARVEAYIKRYHDLALLDRDHDVMGGGTGRSRGVDVWLTGLLPLGIEGRLAWSVLDADRTDASTGIVTRAPFDVTHSLTALIERQWPWITTSAAYRHATGRPVTPVVSAEPDETRDVWLPAYGAPMSERLPGYHRLDLSAAHVRPIGSSFQLVVFWSLSNALDRANVHGWRYTPDYAERIAVRSIFDRAHYFGASLTFLR